MDKPVLIIMAAGMGSRYGGLKQMDPIDEYGHILMDYSAFDAKRAGFERLIIVIKPEMEELFEEKIGHRLRRHIAVDYACQVLDNLPSGFSVPEGRTITDAPSSSVYSRTLDFGSPVSSGLL